MRLLTKISMRFRSLFHRDDVDRDLDSELHFHVERQTAANIAAGMPPHEARRQALIEFGGVEQLKEECRDMRKINWLQDFAQDVRYGLRMLRKSPGFTAVAVLTLALGIGANTAIFSVVNSFLFRPLPIRAPEQIVSLAFQQGQQPLTTAFSVPDIQDFSSPSADVLSDIIGYQIGYEGLAVNGAAQPILINYVTGNYFPALGITPRLGRFIMPSEGKVAGADPVLVLGYSYWKTRFGGDPNVLGKKVTINGTPVTVIGVAPAGFHGLYSLVEAQGYLPLGMLTVETWWNTHDFLTKRDLRNTVLLARLKPEVSVKQAQAVLRVVGQNLSRQYPIEDKAMALFAFPERLSRPNPDPSLKIPKIAALFLLLAGLVLALACVNVANILLVRSAARRREMAVRASLGARRGRLIRQLLTESVVLAFGGGAAGVLLGTGISRSLSSINLSGDVPITLDFSLDWRVFFYAFAAALLTGVLVGIVPALRASSSNLARTLHEGSRTVAAGRNRFRSALVIAEISGSLVLLIVAGLFTRSLGNAQRSDLGFDPHHLLNLTIDPHEIGYNKEQGLAFGKQLLERLRTLPGVRSASLASIVPFSYVTSNDFLQIPGYQPPAGEPAPLVWDNFVSPGYFSTMNIPIVEGRDFTDADNETAPPVAIVNQSMAAQFWPQEDPVGRKFTFGSGTPVTVRIVGVAKDSRFQSMTGPMDPYFFVSLAQTYLSLQTIHVRTNAPPEAIAREVQSAVESLAPGMPVFNVETMTQALGTLQGLLVFRFGAALAASLGFLGLILAVVGVYGVISHAASQRIHEFGIRMALGAQPLDILKMIFRQGLMIVATGVVLGLLVASAFARLLSNFLVGVRPTDPYTYAGVSIVLGIVALLASYLPARRAMKVDPMVALRYE
jgi:putative ABC transport system permease protein